MKGEIAGLGFWSEQSMESGPVFGLSISKVFVNFREGEIHAKIGHFRYSSDIRVVLPDL